MTELTVRTVTLPAMRVASALGFGKEPENQASAMIVDFARKNGMEPGTPAYRTFGFNNPNPSLGSPEYGYELWLPVGPEVKAEPPIVLKEIPKATYAVTRFVGLSHIGDVWRRFAAWFEDAYGNVPPCEIQCWLEEVLNPAEPDPEKWIFDLYLRTHD